MANDIVWVGPFAHAEAERHEQLGNAILLPGLVNAHTHLELTGMRGFLEGLPFGDWLRVLTAVRAQVLTEGDLLDAARFGVSEALRAGITTLADTAESASPWRAMREAGCVVACISRRSVPICRRSRGVHARAAVGRVALACGRRTPLVQIGVSPHAPYTVSPDLFRAVADMARAEHWPLAVHIAESVAESQLVRDGAGPFADRLRARGLTIIPTGCSPIALLRRMRAARRAAVADSRHPRGRHGSGAHRESTAQRSCTVPSAIAKLGQGIAPVRTRCRHTGWPLALGTDSVASNDRMDLLGEARQATLLQALRRGIPDALSASEALTAATLGGARALRLDARIGTLDAGKEADLAAFSLAHEDAQPIHDPAVTLVHVLAGASPARLVVVAGRELVRDGRLLNHDPDRAGRLEALGGRLRQWRLQHVNV